MQTTAIPSEALTPANSKTTSTPKIIDCDFNSKIINDWKVIDQKRNGQLEWNSGRIKLHLSHSQEKEKGRSILGEYLEKEVSSLNACNANVLDFLEKNPKEIPESFKPTGDAVFQANIFWGTVYENTYGKKFVRSLLCFKHGLAVPSYVPVDHGFSSSYPAVIWK